MQKNETNLKPGLSFEVSDIEINTVPFETETGNNLIRKKLLSEIEASSFLAENLVSIPEEEIKIHHFLLMIQRAFSEHKAITIRPDDFWLIICQGFSEHIKLNGSSLKHLITDLKKKQTIKVQRDDFVKGKKDNPWPEIFPEFSKQVNEYLKSDLYSKLVCEFSTSTKTDVTAFEISFLDGMSEYFDYLFYSLCGIPKITLEGSIEDYRKILSNLDELEKYDLGWWIKKIKPIIHKIIETLSGNIDKSFWESIFKETNASGGPYMSGWISNFFPYVRESYCKSKKWTSIFERNPYRKNAVKKLNETDLGLSKLIQVLIKNPILSAKKECELKIDMFPTGISAVPFKWEIFSPELKMTTTYKMNFNSGFIGFTENLQTNSLQSQIAWAITEEK
ncbi:MAG: DUF4419 domain-containing protein [Bacteroidia bacterium]|nr:DUF4419 domain-containing protein [Bacteroidia bacterium]